MEQVREIQKVSDTRRIGGLEKGHLFPGRQGPDTRRIGGLEIRLFRHRKV